MKARRRHLKADWGHLAVSSLIVLLSLLYYLDARLESDALYNMILIAPCVAAIVFLYFVMLVMEIRVDREAGDDNSDASDESRGRADGVDTRRAYALMCLALGFVALIVPLGFDLCSFLFSGLALLVLGERRFLRIVVFAALTSLTVTSLLVAVAAFPVPTLLF